MGASLTVIARRLNFIRETAPNDGAWVTFIQRFTGNKPGDSWCASFVCLVLDVAYRGQSPLPKSAWCPSLLSEGRSKGWIVTDPRPDDIFFYVNAAGMAHHIGIVTGVTPLTGIAGNTSEDGTSSNGTGVFEHPISATVFLRLPPTP